MIQLSYSTINMVYEASHNWLNKQMGLKPEDHAYYHQGKTAHDAIQAHVSGKNPREDLVHIKHFFPIVEEKDFDERCKFNYTLEQLMKNGTPDKDAYLPKEEYNMIGFFDGLNVPEHKFLEIKASSTMWTLKKFFDLMQRKIYGLAMPEMKEAICVTCPRDMKLWEVDKPKVFELPIMQRERNEALNWILGGIKIIESGEYTGGLDASGHCANPDRCYYGVNCNFRI